MLLMRRTHLDFRTLAQTLAVDRARRDRYIQVRVRRNTVRSDPVNMSQVQNAL